MSVPGSARVAVSLSFAFLLAAGCSQDKAELAAEVGAEIREEPDRAEEILEDHDMTIEEFEALMFEVASDPDLSESYQEALPPEGSEEDEDSEGDDEEGDDEEGDDEEYDDEEYDDEEE